MARKKKKTGPTYYTTYQVSQVLGVSLPTVVNWVNSNMLDAHRTPGGHRRIARNDLIAFAREYNYPLSEDFLSDAPGKKRVLIVDDEQDFADMVKDYLVLKGGYEVEAADSGFAAGYTIARFKPDVILMDIMMPDMDGFEVLRMLRSDKSTRHIPVIACTAYRDPDVEERIREDAFHDYIQKPLKLDQLMELVRLTIGSSTES